MNADITELLIFFDEMDSSSDEEQGFYCFKSTYKNKAIVKLRISLFEETSTISVYVDGEEITTSIRFNYCLSINILDQEKKCIELLHKNGRCFLSLNEGINLEYEELDDDEKK